MKSNAFSRAALALIALAPLAAYAQGRGELRPPRPGPDGPGFAMFMEPIEPAKGAPFQAQSVHEHTETLSDGNRIARTATTAVCRDGEGRTRRERDGHVFVDDPVAGKGYVLDAETQTAMRRPPLPPHRPGDAPGVPQKERPRAKGRAPRSRCRSAHASSKASKPRARARP